MDEEPEPTAGWDEKFRELAACIPEIGPPVSEPVIIGGGGPTGEPVVVQAGRRDVLLWDGDGAWRIGRR